MDKTIEHLKKLKSIHNGSNYGADIDEAIIAIEQIRCLIDRPCSVCKFKKENGCSNWECVFGLRDTEVREAIINAETIADADSIEKTEKIKECCYNKDDECQLGYGKCSNISKCFTLE